MLTDLLKLNDEVQIPNYKGTYKIIKIDEKSATCIGGYDSKKFLFWREEAQKVSCVTRDGVVDLNL